MLRGATPEISLNVGEQTLLTYEDFDRLYRIIQKHVYLRLDILLLQETEIRVKILREQLTPKDYLPEKKFTMTEEYREIAIEFIEKDYNSKINSQMTDKICEQVGITSQVFIESRDELAIQNESIQMDDLIATKKL